MLTISIPVIVVLLAALGLRNNKVRLFLILIGLALIPFNIWLGWWPVDVYAIFIATIVFLINPTFFQWLTKHLSKEVSTTKLSYQSIKLDLYVALVLISAWLIGWGLFWILGNHFVTRALISIIATLIIFFGVKQNTRFFAPGISVIIANFAVQIIPVFYAQSLSIWLFLLVTMILAIMSIFWLLENPGIFPILFLIIIQFFYFGDFTFILVNADLEAPEIMMGITIMCCWLLILPVILLFVGEQQILKQQLERRSKPS